MVSSFDGLGELLCGKPDDALRPHHGEMHDEQLCDDEQFDGEPESSDEWVAPDERRGVDDVGRIRDDVVDNDDDCAVRKCR